MEISEFIGRTITLFHLVDSRIPRRINLKVLPMSNAGENRFLTVPHKNKYTCSQKTKRLSSTVRAFSRTTTFHRSILVSQLWLSMSLCFSNELMFYSIHLQILDTILV
ncbi:MAG: hypothetical protein SGI87_06155 [Flavobacteriales bacterium]|nr:hypothetical protein [Flavobacteriales bacterium]